MPIASPAPTATSRIRVELAFLRAGRRDAAPTVAGDRSGVTEATVAQPKAYRATARSSGSAPSASPFGPQR